MRKRKLVLFTLVLSVVMVAFFFLTRRSAPVPRIFPKPNGYDEIITAAKVLPRDFPDTAAMADVDLRDFLRTNQVPLQAIRVALQKPCVVSDWPTAENLQYMDNLSSFKRIARCFAATGNVSEKDGRNRDAAMAYLDAIRLGARGLREGVLIDRLVANACESVGAKPLKALVERLSAAECREVISAMEEIEEQREPMEETLACEREFMRQSSRNLSQQLATLITFRSINKVFKNAAARTDVIVLLERQTIIDLAARAYELENGKPPSNTQELVPKYLKAVPQDPSAKTNLSL